jgi:uncharacterized membrane protein YfcA
MKLTVGFVAALIALGLLGGLMSSLLGIGSGIIMVPILGALWEKTVPNAQKVAQGTALAMMVPMSIAGALSYHFGGQQTQIRFGLPMILWCLGIALVAIAVPLCLGPMFGMQKGLGYVNWNWVAILAVGAVIGSTWLGAPAAMALPVDVLKKIFGVFIILVGLRMLGVYAIIGALFTRAS